MSLASALRGPVGSLVRQFGRADVVVLHRSSGTFDAETGKRARTKEPETVPAVVVDNVRHEQDQGSSPGRALGRWALIAARDLSDPPVAEDIIKFPKSGSPAEAWKVVEVVTVEESGTAILYKCRIVR